MSKAPAGGDEIDTGIRQRQITIVGCHEGGSGWQDVASHGQHGWRPVADCQVAYMGRQQGGHPPRATTHVEGIDMGEVTMAADFGQEIALIILA